MDTTWAGRRALARITKKKYALKAFITWVKGRGRTTTWSFAKKKILLDLITTFRVLFGKKSQSPGNTGDKHSWGVHLRPLPSSNCHGPEVELCPISPSTNERPQKLGIWNRHMNPKRQLKIIMRNDRIWCILLWTNNMAMHTGSPIQRGVFFIDISSLTRNNHFPMSHIPCPMSWQRSHRRIGVALASRFGDLYIIFIHSANGSLVTNGLVVYYVRCFSRNPGCEGQNQVSSTSCTKSIELLLRPWKSSPPKEKWGVRWRRSSTTIISFSRVSWFHVLFP